MEAIDIGIMLASIASFMFVVWVYKDRPEDNYEN